MRHSENWKHIFQLGDQENDYALLMYCLRNEGTIASLLSPNKNGNMNGAANKEIPDFETGYMVKREWK